VNTLSGLAGTTPSVSHGSDGRVAIGDRSPI
jgi:hypothetical protein